MRNETSPRAFRDRDFIRTNEGYFFCVVGPYHPSDRVIAYLKYIPAETGKWKDTGRHYERVMEAYTIPNLLETFRLLQKKHPEYLFHSEFYNITMTAVPHNRIAQHYKPEEKLEQTRKTTDRDALQNKLVALTDYLATESGIAPDRFGVTGSILLNIHNPEFSDIDLIVYGQGNSFKLKEALTQAYSKPNSPLRRFEGALLKDWCKKKAERFPLSLEEAKRIYERKWNIGTFQHTAFSVHPAKLEQELTEKYGDKTFHPEGHVTIRAVVEDDSESLFLHCVYGVRDVEILEGERVDVSEVVVSYESLYDNLAAPDEKIMAKGKLERVHDNRNNEEYYRLLVGSPEGKGGEYIKPLA